MKFPKSFIGIALGLSVLAQIVHAEENGFIIDDIQVVGLQRIATGTVFSYLPVKVGDLLDSKQAAAALRALFKTGFFKDVRLGRDGNVLVVVVEERPAISSIKIEGNKDISSDDLTKALKGIGLSEGKAYDKQILDKVEQELRRQYYSRGKYALKIDSEVSELSRNRVAINIKISEGKAAKIKQINIVGNNVFNDDDLLTVFELSTPTITSFYTKNDQYSKQKLSADLERLRSYYLDRGYINFNIESTQVSISPNKKDIYITINVKEGEQFVVNEVKVTGKTIVQPDELIPLVKIGPGDTFSRKLATETSKAITDRLGDEGYIFSNVNMVPDIKNSEKKVDITFFVDPGKQVYVHHINMRGNTKTRDDVLRREMRQMEAAWASSTKIERSKTRLERLGFFQEVNVETPAVPGTTDQIDINYNVVEKASGNLMAGLGYSQAQGIIFNASVTQDNFLGTGKKVNFTFNNSSYNTIYKLGYLNPFTTIDGISTGFDLSYRETNASRAYITRYATDVADAGFNVGMPLNEFDRLRLSVDIEHTNLKDTDKSSLEIQNFVRNEGSGFYTLPISLGWSHDTLNRAIFANTGGVQSLTLMGTVPGSDLEYYKLNYRNKNYFAVASDLTLMLNGEVGYGDGYGSTSQLPFFENYYAGGINSVRGFMPNTLGPRDSLNRPIGGTSKLVGTAELLFPVPFLKENKSIRLGTFIDVGSVFGGTKCVSINSCETLSAFDVGQLRYSAGLSATWMSPFGPLIFSVAQPISKQPTDQTQSFQFSFGSGF